MSIMRYLRIWMCVRSHNPKCTYYKLKASFLSGKLILFFITIVNCELRAIETITRKDRIISPNNPEFYSNRRYAV